MIKQQSKDWVRVEEGKILSWTQLGGANARWRFGLQTCMKERPSKARPATSLQIFVWKCHYCTH